MSGTLLSIQAFFSVPGANILKHWQDLCRMTIILLYLTHLSLALSGKPLLILFVKALLIPMSRGTIY